MDKNKHGPKLLSILEGAVWDACKHLEPKEVAGEAGADMIFQTLDPSLGDPKDVLLIEAADGVLCLTGRHVSEDIVTYQARLDTKFRKLESACSISLPSSMKGFILTKQARMALTEVREC